MSVRLLPDLRKGANEWLEWKSIRFDSGDSLAPFIRADSRDSRAE
jgi:hypothetical protein